MHHEQYMRRAIELALRGSGYAAPNPMVGAVLVYGGRIIGEGFHAAYGDVHAEVACLQGVLKEDRRLIPLSTMYVTLEPCAHQGRQPPCAHRLVQEGILHVVVAVEDPFEAVHGRGIAILKEAGVRVDVGVCADEARWMCRRFLQAHKGGRPYVVLKWAQSADGFIAPEDGSRFQLSNSFSRALVHKWRTEESAIMVGYNTALADNPQLTARDWHGIQPLRIAIDRRRQLPPSHYLLDRSVPTWIVNEQEEGEDGIRYIRLPFDAQLLPALLQRLSAAKQNSLLAEGGAAMLQSFIDAGLWDEARIITSSKILGKGLAAPSLTDSRRAFSVSIADDLLNLYHRADSSYPYVAGMAL